MVGHNTLKRDGNLVAVDLDEVIGLDHALLKKAKGFCLSRGGVVKLFYLAVKFDTAQIPALLWFGLDGVVFLIENRFAGRDGAAAHLIGLDVPQVGLELHLDAAVLLNIFKHLLGFGGFLGLAVDLDILHNVALVGRSGPLNLIAAALRHHGRAGDAARAAGQDGLNLVQLLFRIHDLTVLVDENNINRVVAANFFKNILILCDFLSRQGALGRGAFVKDDALDLIAAVFRYAPVNHRVAVFVHDHGGREGCLCRVSAGLAGGDGPEARGFARIHIRRNGLKVHDHLMVAAHPGKRNGSAVADRVIHAIHSDGDYTVAIGRLPFYFIVLPSLHGGGLGEGGGVAAAVFGGINGIPFLWFGSLCFFFKYNADMVVLVNGAEGDAAGLSAV